MKTNLTLSENLRTNNYLKIHQSDTLNYHKLVKKLKEIFQIIYHSQT